MSNLETDKWIAKYKSVGMADKWIADKLGLPIIEVQLRWGALVSEAQSNKTNGYTAFCDAFTILAHQYQLVGESLKAIASVLGGVMTEHEIRQLIDENPEVTVKNFKMQAIVLRPYTPPPAELPPSPGN